MNYRKRILHELEVDNEAVELTFPPIDPHDILTRKLANGLLVVGYLSQDSNCQNPLDNCDGSGHIYRRGRRGSRKDEEAMQEVMGLNSRWEPNLDLVDWTTVRNQSAAREGDAWKATRLRQLIEDAQLSPTAALETLNEEIRNGCYDRELTDLAEANWKEQLENGEIGNHYAVWLDCYEHGGEYWSICGQDQQCRWDTTGRAGLWVADSACADHIRVTAAEKLGIKINTLQVACVAVDPKDSRPWQLEIIRPDHEPVRVDDWSVAGGIVQKLAREQFGQKALRAAEDEVMLECARQALEEYNAWLSGECYGVVVEWFKDGEQVDHDACWGHVGTDYAETELETTFEATCQFLEKNHASQD
jgi:hypothetical protein